MKKLNKNSENSVGSCAPFCGERNMMKQRKIELLAPAKNLECGIEAVNHGADAVYIGAPKFGARAAAVNSLEDIAALVAYAHLYNVRIYVTVNTILKEEELAETEKMIWELYRIGVDALIVQDMGITRLNLPPIPLHGSTQMDNRTPEKVRFLADAGFRQVVLARELSLQEIRRIHETCPETPLEVFVHGALCVSYSGQCYVSQACFGRSANRGECAQFCRLPFSLVDADGKTIVRDKHLLSLKDLNQSEVLEDLLDAERAPDTPLKYESPFPPPADRWCFPLQRRSCSQYRLPKYGPWFMVPRLKLVLPFCPYQYSTEVTGRKYRNTEK